jgi:hypothetical protein
VGEHRAYALEQLRPVYLAVVHENVRVDVGRRGKIPLTDAGTDLGPGSALVMEQTDPPVPQVVRRERRYRSVPAGPCNRHAEAIGRTDREERRFEVAILACR